MKFCVATAVIVAIFALTSARPAKVTDKVYFDMSIGGTPKGKIVIGLFGE